MIRKCLKYNINFKPGVNLKVALKNEGLLSSINVAITTTTCQNSISRNYRKQQYQVMHTYCGPTNVNVQNIQHVKYHYMYHKL
jgi:hypothetical protein